MKSLFGTCGCISFGLFGVLLYYLQGIYNNTRFLGQVDKWFREKGLEATLGRVKHHSHSLPPEEEKRRNELMERGRLHGLDKEEGAELRELMEKDARSDLADGVISALAFAVIIAFIAWLIRQLVES